MGRGAALGALLMPGLGLRRRELHGNGPQLRVGHGDGAAEVPPVGLNPPLLHRVGVGTQVDARWPVEALRRIAPVVDLDREPGRLQRLVGLGRPGCPRLREPLFGLEAAGLERPA